MTATLALAGCSSFDLSRLAPPGIVKHEEIASEKPPNPAIAEMIAARKQTADPRFPVLSQTPAAGPPPPRPDRARIDAETTALVAARETLEAGLAEDRAAAEAESAERDALSRRRESLDREVDEDAAAARGERTEPLPNSTEEKQ